MFGVTGRAILRALIDGDRTPDEMATLARGQARKKIGLLAGALGGRLAEHQRLMLRLQLDRVEAAERDIETIDDVIAPRLEPYREHLMLLAGIPGIDRIGAVAILAESHRRPSGRVGRRLPRQQPECR